LLFLTISGRAKEKRKYLGGQHVDEVLCSVQASIEQSQAKRSDPLRVRLGMVTAMAKVIEYYERKMDFDRAARKGHPVSRTGKEISMSTETRRLEKASGVSRPLGNGRD
jgi:hypothetical protein